MLALVERDIRRWNWSSTCSGHSTARAVLVLMTERTWADRERRRGAGNPVAAAMSAYEASRVPCFALRASEVAVLPGIPAGNWCRMVLLVGDTGFEPVTSSVSVQSIGR